MIAKLSKENASKFAKKFDLKLIGNKQVDCGELNAESIGKFIEMANYLHEPKKLKCVAECSEDEIVALYSYNPVMQDEEMYFAGLLEVPEVAVAVEQGCAEKVLDEVESAVKFKCDSKTEDMMYYSTTADNFYLNVSKNVMGKLSTQKLKMKMFGDLRGVLRRIKGCGVAINAVPFLPLEAPFDYLYVVQGMGRKFSDLMRCKVRIPDMSEYYANTGAIALDCDGTTRVYVPGYGLVSEEMLGFLSAEPAGMPAGMPAEVFG